MLPEAPRARPDYSPLVAERFDGPVLGGRWKLGRKLGSGGQGTTHLARDCASPEERIAVVKSYKLGGDSGWKKYDLFQREIEVLGRLEHPAIPGFIGTFEQEAGSFHLVMERVPGRTLEAIAQTKPLPDDELRDLAVRVLDVLIYLHQQDPPVIHRDIKPANLVRDDDGTVHLVDFGGVRSAMRSGGGSTVVGTFGYMAPEQLHGEASPRTDLYGLGATLVALAGGVEPETVPRKGLRMDLKKHFKAQGIDVKSDLVTFLEELTQPDPDARPATATDALALLGDPDRLRATVRPDDRALVHDELSDLPPGLREFMRVLMAAAGATGYLGLLILQRMMLPILWAFTSAALTEDNQKKLVKWRTAADRGLDEARGECRQLMSPRRRALPPGK